MKVKGVSISSKRGILYLYWREFGQRKGESTGLKDTDSNRLLALEYAIKKKRELNQPIPSGKIFKSLYGAINDFLALKKSPVYHAALNVLKSQIEDTFLRDLTERHFINLDFDRFSHNTKATYFKHYRIFFRWVHKKGWIDDPDIVPKIKFTTGKPIQVYSFIELRRMHELFKDNPKHLFAFKFLYKSGFRLGEAARLNYEDIQNGVIYVKNDKGNRVDPFPLKPVEFIGTGKGSVLGFKSANGFYRMRLKMQKEGFTLKGLRSTFATRWAGKLTPYELQKLMRHNDIRTTMKYYVGIDIKSIGSKM